LREHLRRRSRSSRGSLKFPAAKEFPKKSYLSALTIALRPF
jgi:hypothetical protein